MNTIKLDIKNIVKSNLQEKREERFNSSFKKLVEIEDPILLGEKFFQTSTELLNEGYSIEEIEGYLNEIENPLAGVTDNVNFTGMFKDSLYSSAKEYLIKWFLDYLGVNENLSVSLSQFFADVPILTLLKPFKNAQYCEQYLPAITAGVMETVVRYLGGKVTGTDRKNYEWSGSLSVVGGNIVGQAIRESGAHKTVSTYFCKIIHNK
jgi:hypothetical protein